MEEPKKHGLLIKKHYIQLKNDLDPKNQKRNPENNMHVRPLKWLRSKFNSRDKNSVLYLKKVGFKNSGLTLEFCLLVGIGRSGVMIGSLCLNMV